MLDKLKTPFGIFMSLVIIGAIVYFKWKLLNSRMTLFLLTISALVFVASTPAKAE